MDDSEAPEKAEIQIWWDDTGWDVVVDADGMLWTSTDRLPPVRMTHDDLGWTEHEYKSFAGVLRAVGQTVAA